MFSWGDDTGASEGRPKATRRAWPLRVCRHARAGSQPLCRLGPDASDHGHRQGEQLDQTEAAQRCGLTQPRMNDLLRGPVSRFSRTRWSTSQPQSGARCTSNCRPPEPPPKSQGNRALCAQPTNCATPAWLKPEPSARTPRDARSAAHPVFTLFSIQRPLRRCLLIHG